MEGYIAKDLTGKYIIDVPPYQVFSGFMFKSRIVNFSATYKYKGETWADDENTIKVDAYSLIDAKNIQKIC